VSHPVDVEQLKSLAGRAISSQLARMGMRLDQRRHDDLHDYIVELGIGMAAEYDPAVGQSFSTFYFRRARMRVIDWLRSTHGDPRHTLGALSKLPVSYPESLDTLEAANPGAFAKVLDDPADRDSLADAIVSVGKDLSPDARWALVNVAGRIVQGYTLPQALSEAAGSSAVHSAQREEAKRRFECLRAELEPRARIGSFTRAL
jgi:hypothetical protein